MAWLLLAGVGGARGDEAKRREADVRFHRGLELYDGGDFTAALAEFQAAHELTGSWRVLVHVAICQRALFRYGEAVETFERYLAEGGEEIEASLRAQVERELLAIRGVVAEVVVRVDGAPAKLELDGRFVGESPLERPLLVGPGRHVVRASRDGNDPAEKAIDVVSGEKLEIDLAPTPRPPAPRTAPVEIFTSPPGAMLSIDGKPVGLAPWRGELDDGDHEVVATLDGYEKARRDVSVRAGRARRLTVDLVRKLAPVGPRPWHSKWYVWGGIGAGIAVAVVGTIFIVDATRPDYDLSLFH